MIELISIIFTFFSFILFSIFPFQILYSQKVIFNYNYNNYDILFLNLIVNISILLVLSFTKIDYFYYFIMFSTISLISNFYFLIQKKSYFKKYFNINFIFFILLNIFIFIYLAQDPTLSWDSQKNWFYKAQSFFYNYNFFDLSDMEGVNYYPHLGTFLWGFFWKNSILQYEYFGRLIYIYIFLLSIFSICDLLKKSENIKIILVSILLLICFDNFLFRGYQEVLIFSLLIFSTKNFYNYILSQNKKFLLISFICINLLPWIKNEGYLFLIVFNFSLLFLGLGFLKKKEVIYFILSSLILLIFKKYLFFRYLGIDLFHGGTLDLVINLNILFEYIYFITLGFIIAIFKYKVWLFILLSIFYLNKKNKNFFKDLKIIKFLKINFFLYLILVLGIYFSYVNHIYGLSWWIDNSLDRIIYQISGFFIIYIILAVNYIKINI